MLHQSVRLMAIVGLAALFAVARPYPAWAQTVGNAQSFAIVGGQGVNANGSGSVVNGDVGINPAAATFITGFPANATIAPPFSNHGNDATAISASVSTLTLFNSAVMAPAGATLIGGDNLSIGGPSVNGHYTPGRYTNAGGAAIIPTSITLDGAGIYVFTLANALTTSANVILNGVDPCSVFWRIPTQATLNGLVFPGTVVSDGIIALGSGVNVTGRALTTANGSVTLAGGDTIGGCSSAVAAITIAPVSLTNGTGGVPFSQTLTGSGGIAPFTFTVTAGPLPPGLTLTPAGVLSGTPTTPGTFTFTIRGTDATGAFVDQTFTVAIISAVPTLPQAFVVLLALGLTVVGYFRLRRRARAE